MAITFVGSYVGTDVTNSFATATAGVPITASTGHCALQIANWYPSLEPIANADPKLDTGSGWVLDDYVTSVQNGPQQGLKNKFGTRIVDVGGSSIGAAWFFVDSGGSSTIWGGGSAAYFKHMAVVLSGVKSDGNPIHNTAAGGTREGDNLTTYLDINVTQANCAIIAICAATTTPALPTGSAYTPFNIGGSAVIYKGACLEDAGATGTKRIRFEGALGQTADIFAIALLPSGAGGGSLTKKWQVPFSTNGVTVTNLQIQHDTAGVYSIVDQASSVTSSGGYLKFNVTTPGSYSAGDKRLAVAHDFDGNMSSTSFHLNGGVATVIEE